MVAVHHRFTESRKIWTLVLAHANTQKTHLFKKAQQVISNLTVFSAAATDFTVAFNLRVVCVFNAVSVHPLCG